MTKKNVEVVTLSNGVTVDGKSVKEITLRQPTAGELRGLQMMMIVQMDTNTMLKLLPRITQPALSDVQLSQMSSVDMFALASAAMSFFATESQKMQL